MTDDLYMMTIFRDEFRAAIEAGIANAPYYGDKAKYALRSVGLRADHISYGSFRREIPVPCGCPMSEAGLTTESGRLTEFGEREDVRENFDFIGPFDDAMAAIRQRLNSHARVAKIVD